MTDSLDKNMIMTQLVQTKKIVKPLCDLLGLAKPNVKYPHYAFQAIAIMTRVFGKKYDENFEK